MTVDIVDGTKGQTTVDGKLVPAWRFNTRKYTEALLRTALALAEQKIYVFPVSVTIDSATGKKTVKPYSISGPLAGKVLGWRDLSTIDEVVITNWFTSERAERAGSGVSGLAIDCGKSGLVVADIDGRAGESGWSNILRRLEAYGLSFGEGAGAETWSGGRHIFFRASGDPDCDMKNTAGAIGARIDTRGEGGFVIAAPTVIFSDNGYRETSPDGGSFAHHVGRYRWTHGVPDFSEQPVFPRVLKVLSECKTQHARNKFWAELRAARALGDTGAPSVSDGSDGTVGPGTAGSGNMGPASGTVVRADMAGDSGLGTPGTGITGKPVVVLDWNWGGDLQAEIRALQGRSVGVDHSAAGFVPVAREDRPTGLEDWEPEEFIFTFPRAMRCIGPFYELAAAAPEGERNVLLNNLAVTLSHYYDPIFFPEDICGRIIASAAASCKYVGPRELIDVKRFIEIATGKIQVKSNNWKAKWVSTVAADPDGPGGRGGSGGEV